MSAEVRKTFNYWINEAVSGRDGMLVAKQLINLYPSRFKDGWQTLFTEAQFRAMIKVHFMSRSHMRNLLTLVRKQSKTVDKYTGNVSIIEQATAKSEGRLPKIGVPNGGP